MGNCLTRPASSADNFTTARPASTQPIAASNTQACTALRNVMFDDQDEPICGGANDEALSDGQYRSAAIVHKGKQQEITSQMLADACSALCKSISAGSHALPDANTAQAIQDTLCEAVQTSPSFQHAVRFSLGDSEEEWPLLDVRFAMDSDTDGSRPSARRDAASPPPAAVTPVQNEATTATSESDAEDEITIYVSAPPPPNTPEMDYWKAELIHMVLKVITGATKPKSKDEDGAREGAKVLAHVVAREMKWRIPGHLESWLPSASRQPSFMSSLSIDPPSPNALSITTPSFERITTRSDPHGHPCATWATRTASDMMPAPAPAR